jgi:hypothetical protein
MVLLSQCPYSTLCLRNIISHVDATAPAHLPQLRDRLCPHGYARRLSLLFPPVLDLAGEEELLRALGLREDLISSIIRSTLALKVAGSVK